MFGMKFVVIVFENIITFTYVFLPVISKNLLRQL